MRSVVVLPQPDGPSIEKNSPRSISSDRSSTATTSWKRFVMWSSRTSRLDGTNGSLVRAGTWSEKGGRAGQTGSIGPRLSAGVNEPDC